MTTFGPGSGSLWGMDAPHLARRSDPATSHKAAAEVAPELGAMQARVVELMRGHGGKTATELSRLAGDADPRRINRRLSELVRDGRVIVGAARPCAVTGRTCQTYWLTEEIHPCNPTST